ncbi:MAG: uracil-DNA glycosylase [Anaerolineae bacterium]|nr:uracil-DNA glycosylase [Anaerolineae bacterium]
MTQDRAAALAVIAEQVRACKLCRLHENTTNGVPGAGDPHAEYMFIGEGPGFHEDQKGLPFVGRSGDYLESLLRLLNLKREQVFIANVVKHRPPENRDPMPDEIQACRAYLDQQIDVIDPLVIVTLGRFSMARYFPNGKITQIHGQAKYDERRAYYPLFHPAAVLRNPDLGKSMEADFRRLPEVLAKVKELRGKISPPTPEAPQPEEKPTQLKLF